MKTLTEFFGRNLKFIEEQMAMIQLDAKSAAEEVLKIEGKTEEEIQTALPEAIKTAVATKITELTKLEGEKIDWLFAALDMVKGKKGSIKRVLVMSAGEGEKVPAGLKEVDGKYFSVELFPEAARPGAKMETSRDERGGRRDGKKGGRDGKGRGGPGGRGGDDRRPRRPEGAPAAEAGTSTFVIKTTGVGPTGEISLGGRPPRKPRGEPRGERKPRREATPRAPLTEEQIAERDAKRAERDAARAAKNAEFLAKREAAASLEPQYDGKTNRIKARPPGSAPLAADTASAPVSDQASVTAEQTSSEENSKQA